MTSESFLRARSRFHRERPTNAPISVARATTATREAVRRRSRSHGEEPPQVVGHLAARRVASRRIAGRGHGDDRLQVAGDGGAAASDRHGFGFEREPARLERGRSLVGRPAGEDEVEDRPERVDVDGGLAPPRLAEDLFGRHVAGGPREGPVDGERPRSILDEGPRQAEVGHLGDAGFGQEDVRGLQVPVDHPRLVGVGHRVEDRGHQLGAGAGRWADGLRPLDEGVAGDVIHHEVGDAPLGLAAVEQADDVGVLHQGEEFPLQVEPPGGRPRHPPADELHGHDLAVVVDAPAPIDDPHPPAADHLLQHMPADASPRGQVVAVLGRLRGRLAGREGMRGIVGLSRRRPGEEPDRLGPVEVPQQRRHLVRQRCVPRAQREQRLAPPGLVPAREPMEQPQRHPPPRLARARPRRGLALESARHRDDLRNFSRNLSGPPSAFRRPIRGRFDVPIF
ncbi:MAG: hypothetical protein BGO49_03295 [Planctomycetales bacterium 71-10]|nr:MAG: hypothetical protein BGO49_03295 [Planctomycetales bacterium 71-10]